MSQCMTDTVYLVLYTDNKNIHLNLLALQNMDPVRVVKLPIGIEYDLAVCFACDFWPPAASSWINRCHFWPAKDVVDDIVRNGCRFVPIGHPLGLHKHIECRISFSRAEYKLVHSMHHCQFLIPVYGLLKLFLKEVIDKQSEETSKLLHVFLSHEYTNFVANST